MSQFTVPVVRIVKAGKHPRADSLSITQVFGQNVVFKTDSFKIGDLAVYVPYDAVVDTSDSVFAFLDKNGKGKKHRIKPMRLRGIYSEGLLIPIQPGMTEGQDVSTILGIEKFVEPEDFTMNTDNESDPGFMPRYEVENYLKFKHLLIDQEDVVVTEKIHGSNSRFCYKDGRMWVGSHGCIKKFDERNVWWKVAKKYDLENKLKQYQGLIFYGEVYGVGIQDLTYSVPANEGARLAIFDIFDTNTKTWFNHDDIVETCKILSIPTVNVLFKGPLDRDVVEPLRTGLDTLDNKTIREGIIIRPIKERFNQETGRTVLKLVSEEYKLRKNGTERK